MLHFGGGANRLKVVWYRTHSASNGDAVGPIAVIRTFSDSAEVYAVGTFRGRPEQSEFVLERLGGEVVITASDDGCVGAKPHESCENRLTVLRPWAGDLQHSAEIPLERVLVVAGTERGITGKIEYRMVSTPYYEPGGIRIEEQVSATNEAGQKVRHAELERHLRRRTSGGAFKESSPSLWELFVPQAGSADAGDSQNAGSDETSPDTAKPAKGTGKTGKGKTGKGVDKSGGKGDASAP